MASNKRFFDILVDFVNFLTCLKSYPAKSETKALTERKKSFMRFLAAHAAMTCIKKYMAFENVQFLKFRALLANYFFKIKLLILRLVVD